jgi:hypothetical protein
MAKTLKVSSDKDFFADSSQLAAGSLSPPDLSPANHNHSIKEIMQKSTSLLIKEDACMRPYFAGAFLHSAVSCKPSAGSL